MSSSSKQFNKSRTAHGSVDIGHVTALHFHKTATHLHEQFKEKTMSELSVGAPAPDFHMPAVTRDGEQTLTLSDCRGRQSVVLYFYPKDDTPGCTTQACGFRDWEPQFDQAGGVIWGISPDSQQSHREFAAKYALPFPLLADPDHAVADAYGVWKEKTNYGKPYWGIERTTFVIDKAGMVAKVYPRVRVDQHAEQVLQFVREIGK